jgi:two-component system OmpR family sensor kinase
VEPRLPRSYPSYRPIADVLVVGAVAGVVGVGLHAEPVRASLPASALDLLTLSAAGIGTGSAILAILAARLLDDVRPAWVAAALALYSVVVLPWSTVLATQAGGPQRAPLLVAYVAALVLLVMSIRPPAVLGAWGGWVLAGAGGAAAALALNLPDAGVLRGFAEGPVPTLAALIGWTAAAVAYAVVGLRARSAARLRLGLAWSCSPWPSCTGSAPRRRAAHPGWSSPACGSSGSVSC